MARTSLLATGLLVQGRVISALMVRDILGRFGHENLGFFWVIGEPLLLSCGVMLVWSVMHITHGADIGIVPFALSGYTFITLWRHVVARSQKSMRTNAYLAYHRQVKLIDVLISNALTEALGTFTALIVVLLPLSIMGLSPGINDPLALVGGWFFAAWFSFAFGLILGSVSELNEILHHLTQPLMYLTLPLTGTFFMVDWLPESAQRIMLWSPLVNCIEMIRQGIFPAEIRTHWSSTYLLVCCGLTTSLGLLLYKRAERHLEI